MERDVWILMQAVSPKETAIWIADPEFCAIYLENDAAFDWSPDDPRLSALADRTARWLASRHGKGRAGERSALNPTIAQLVATSTSPSSPALERLTAITRQRMAHI